VLEHLIGNDEIGEILIQERDVDVLTVSIDEHNPIAVAGIMQRDRINADPVIRNHAGGPQFFKQAQVETSQLDDAIESLAGRMAQNPADEEILPTLGTRVVYRVAVGLIVEMLDRQFGDRLYVPAPRAVMKM
jgi:hypothetical protein